MKIQAFTNDNLEFIFTREGEADPVGYRYLFTTNNIANATICASALILMEVDMSYDDDGAVDYAHKKMLNLKDFVQEIAAHQLGEALRAEFRRMAEANGLNGLVN